jgi:hypothetical protein
MMARLGPSEGTADLPFWPVLDFGSTASVAVAELCAFLFMGIA